MQKVECRVQSYRGLVLAVLIEEMEIAISSFASRSNGLACSSLTLPLSKSNSIQNADSSASSRTVANFEIKSALDFARHRAVICPR